MAIILSRDAIVLIFGDTLSAHNARVIKIPGWIALVRENLFVYMNNRSLGMN